MLPTLWSSVVKDIMQLMLGRCEMGRRWMLLAAVTATVAGLLAGGTATAGSPHTEWAGRNGEAPHRVVVKDITIRVRHQDPVQAWLVRPGGKLRKDSTAGVLWLHW